MPTLTEYVDDFWDWGNSPYLKERKKLTQPHANKQQMTKKPMTILLNDVNCFLDGQIEYPHRTTSLLYIPFWKTAAYNTAFVIVHSPLDLK